MERISSRSALSLLSAILFLTFGSLSVSAQYYMNVFQNDGQKFHFIVSDLDSVNFTGQSEPFGDYEYVDLGLSVNWATHNVGASRFVEDYGNLYAWGETEPKSEYSWATYKFSNSYGYLTKYNNNSNNGYNGFTDNKTRLDLEDDVAHVEWGGKWRLPSSAEFEELKRNCTWVWTNQNGVNGYKVTSKISGYTDRSIFLPAAGVGYVPTPGLTDNTNTDLAGSSLGYWSSSLHANNPIGAEDFYYHTDGRSVDEYAPRFFGQSVRPVCRSSAWHGTSTISFDSIERAIIIGSKYKLNAKLKCENNDYIFIPDLIEWSSSDQSIAMVDTNGVVTAYSIGVATITAEIDSIQACCTIIVASCLPTGSENSYDYVDLGLSVKWATINIGASDIGDYGDYFTWGDTELYYEMGYAREEPMTHWKEGKPNGYYGYTFKYHDSSSSTLTKYNTNSSYGIVDNKITLDPEDDAAHVNWGGCWRMPTKAEFVELNNTDNCTWTWTTYYGVNGYLVTSKKPGYVGASIFLPAASCRIGGTLLGVGRDGDYWSSSLNSDSPYKAWNFNFHSGSHYMNNYERFVGRTVRPVCP